MECWMEGQVGASREGPKKCVPFVSQYTDCVDENQCSGCSQCTCTAEATWNCTKVNKCEDVFQNTPVDENDLENALLLMDSAMKRQRLNEARKSKTPFVPQPTTESSVLLVDTDDYKINIADEVMDLLRPKRSVDSPKGDRNDTIKFYHTLDEINEDTLKNTNASGTLKVRKLEVDLPKLSRRAGVLLNNNTSNPLHIEYNKDMYQHINENKIDQAHDKYETHELLGNYSQRQKDRDISKVIVKEMNKGIEIIGDKHAPVMSNVSFTPENETFAAMTYIAGNLLNKLWNMETDSSETIETEVLKHEKIAELIDLFKEPLTMNQEMLLKHAMEELSSAMDKNKNNNISLCEQLGEVKKILNQSNVSQEKKTKDCDKDKAEVTEVIDNVNNVINLVKRLEDVQSHMNTLKSPKHKSGPAQTTSRKISSNHFGSLLESIVKLLLPAKNENKITNGIKNLNMFRKDYDFRNKFKNIFNIALGNITMTTKDKIVLDYLTHIENSPDCLLNGKRSKSKPKSHPSIEGNILLNLSEFFKMKSLNDLLKLVGNDKTNVSKDKVNTAPVLRVSESTTETLTEASVATTKQPINNSKNLTATKEKLKAHLKTILEDLVEMQNARGISKSGGIKITDVLPCIYNILNADKLNSKAEQDSTEKLTSIFSSLKKELKYASYRRSSSPVSERPKSAIVWERVVKNLNEKTKSARRSMDETPPKSVDELKNLMDRLESVSNTYKNVAILNDIPPADRLVLLKTLDADIRKYITLLENIKTSFDAGVIPTTKTNEFNEFIDNVANNIEINEKVVRKINKPKFKTLTNTEIRKPKDNRLSYYQRRQDFTLPKEPVAFNTKITRDQVINQLIKNRISLYIRIKENEGRVLTDDFNYDIAKKILLYLESGSYSLARELYNIFANRQKNAGPANLNAEPVTINSKYTQQNILDKEPLIQFEDLKTRRANLPNQNHLIQQLINMKNMRV